MQIFLDTTQIHVLRELNATGLIDGVTTNPSLIAKSGRPILTVIAEICDIIDGPVSAEVAASDQRGMLAEGRRLAAVASNVVVKLPMSRDGLIATARFAEEQIATNVTLCFSPAQALLAAKAGATYVSPFIGRLDDTGSDGVQLLRDMRAIFDNYDMETKILAASIRGAAHVEAAAVAGADCATVPPSVFEAMFRHPLTDKGLEQFMNDWASAKQSIL